MWGWQEGKRNEGKDEDRLGGWVELMLETLRLTTCPVRGHKHNNSQVPLISTDRAIGCPVKLYNRPVLCIFTGEAIGLVRMIMRVWCGRWWMWRPRCAA